VLFKLLGVALFLPFLHPFEGLVALTTPDLSRQIANAHTLFNGIMAVFFLPLVGPFSKLVARLVPEKAEEKKFGPAYLDEHVLATPALAVGQATREVLRVSDIVRDMLVNSIKVFQSDDPSLIQAVKEKDNFVDILDREIRLYLTRLSSTSLTETQSHRGVALLEITRNLENIGDIIDRNLMPLAAKRINKGVVFTQEGMEEIVLFHRKLVENYDMAISAFAGHDQDLGNRVLRNKEELGIVERELVQAHIERLRKGLRESIETSHIHLDIISNLARINSLITHIIYPIFEETRGARKDEAVLEKR
jgi:phosphate:Na+ symporter